MSLIIGAVVGLVIGWNFLPQPAWAKSLVDAGIARVRVWLGQ